MATADLTVLREQIRAAIRELAGPGATHAPTFKRFVLETPYSHSLIRRCFRSYAIAVDAAGLKPSRTNRQPSREELLECYGQATRHTGAVPTERQYGKFARHGAHTLRRVFGTWLAMPAAFREFASGRAQWADVISILDQDAHQLIPLAVQRAILVQRSNGKTGAPPTCGEQIDFRAMRHAPINELRVVFLFGMLAGELGFTVDIVRAGFPDCEALRPAGDGKWQRVRIEFEFESRSFPVHGHDPSGCDVLVCWRHNWADCPPHLEVLELQQLARMGKG